VLLRGLLGVMPVSRTSCAARFLNRSITHTPFQSLDYPSRVVAVGGGAITMISCVDSSGGE